MIRRLAIHCDYALVCVISVVTVHCCNLKNATPCYMIFNHLKGGLTSSGRACIDPWEWWNLFRSLCDHHQRIAISTHLYCNWLGMILYFSRSAVLDERDTSRCSSQSLDRRARKGYFDQHKVCLYCNI